MDKKYQEISLLEFQKNIALKKTAKTGCLNFAGMRGLSALVVNTKIIT